MENSIILENLLGGDLLHSMAKRDVSLATSFDYIVLSTSRLIMERGARTYHISSGTYFLGKFPQPWISAAQLLSIFVV